MNAKKTAIKRLRDRKPTMGASGRPQYGGAGLSRPEAERVVGNALSKLSGVKPGRSAYASRGKRYAAGVKGKRG